ncbi:MAG: glycosyltransferase family A protein [Flavobacterium sp.]
MDVSVLICTIPDRNDMFVSLYKRLNDLKSKVSIQIEILYDDALGITIGEKRNKLLKRATGKYCCFIDDDDGVADTYFTTYESAINSGMDYDCVMLVGHYYLNGNFMKPFFHSLKYKSWYDDKDGYYRCPNHLNLIKTDICRHIGYTQLNFGEDKDFSERLSESGLIKTEYVHNNLLYLYYKIDVTKPNLLKRKRMGMFF